MGFIRVIWPLVLLLIMATAQAQAQLTAKFYKNSCPNFEKLVTPVVASALQKDPRMAASLLRLLFHDCFVNGCDGSILLDDTSTFTGEKGAFPNVNSARGFEVIDAIKSAVEYACPGVVSCADIVAIAARDSVVLSKGPSWEVLLGRRDSTTASEDDANNDLPGPGSDVSQLVQKFQLQGLSARDMVALSGAHTIGQAHCKNFRNRIYNENTTIDERYASVIQGMCPKSNSRISKLRTRTTVLRAKEAILRSDQSTMARIHLHV